MRSWKIGAAPAATLRTGFGRVETDESAPAAGMRRLVRELLAYARLERSAGRREAGFATLRADLLTDEETVLNERTGYGTPSRAHAPGALSCLDLSAAGRDSTAARVLATGLAWRAAQFVSQARAALA